MLTFEKVLKVFQAYLDDDPLSEVVQTSHGYTLMAWAVSYTHLDVYTRQVRLLGAFRRLFSYHHRKEAKHDETKICADTMPGIGCTSQCST